MTIAIALLVVGASIALLSIDRIPVEVSALSIVVMLALSGLVTPGDALSGFSSEAAIFIFALLALTQGLEATGVMQLVGRRMMALARFGPGVFTAVLLCVVCAFSAVASNTAVTAAFLPVAVGCARQARLPPGRLLMPMAFASMLGGTITLFGTSTNLVVSAAMEDLGLGRLGFLELAKVGVPVALIGLLVTLALVRRLLRPRGSAVGAEALVRRRYLAEAVVPSGSRLAGRHLAYLTGALGVPVRGVLREDRALRPDADLRLQAGDHLVVAGGLEDVLRVKDLRSVLLAADLRYGHGAQGEGHLLEVSIPPSSALVGQSVRELRFAERFGILVLGIHRHPTLGEVDPELQLVDAAGPSGRWVDAPIAPGDLLLLAGPEARLRALAADPDFTVLARVPYERPRYARAPLALAIFAATIAAAGTGVTSAAVAGLAGVVAMIATGCVPARTAFRVDWRVVLLVGALLALGSGVERSGAGELAARGLLPLAGVVGPRGVLIALMVGTILLSIPLSNQAAALLMLPVGLHAALELGVSPRTFAVGICLAASCSFLTPLEPSAALVYGPGRYRFSDFLKVGTPVTAVALCVLSVGVPLVWPFGAAAATGSTVSTWSVSSTDITRTRISTSPCHARTSPVRPTQAASRSASFAEKPNAYTPFSPGRDAVGMGIDSGTRLPSTVNTKSERRSTALLSPGCALESMSESGGDAARGLALPLRHRLRQVVRGRLERGAEARVQPVQRVHRPRAGLVDRGGEERRGLADRELHGRLREHVQAAGQRAVRGLEDGERHVRDLQLALLEEGAHPVRQPLLREGGELDVGSTDGDDGAVGGAHGEKTHAGSQRAGRCQNLKARASHTRVTSRDLRVDD